MPPAGSKLPNALPALPRFLATRAMVPYVGAELAQKLAEPLKFQWGIAGAGQLPGMIYGFDVTLLIDLCRTIIQAEADGKLGKRHSRIVAQAHVILTAAAIGKRTRLGKNGDGLALRPALHLWPHGVRFPTSPSHHPQQCSRLKNRAKLKNQIRTLPKLRGCKEANITRIPRKFPKLRFL